MVKITQMRKMALRQATFRLAIVAFALLAPLGLRAQDLADYTFSTGTDANQWITLSSSAQSIVASGDDKASSLTNIGFSFPFGDGIYTQFWANSNGIFSFSSSPATSYSTQFTSSNLSANQPKICGITRDMCVPSSGGYVKYELVGTAPNRILVCEFNLGATSSASSATVNFQVQLHEANSKVVMVYGATASPSGFQIGLSQSTTDLWLINPSTHAATHATTYNSSTYSTWPGENRYYAFERPVVSCPKPTGLAASNLMSNRATLSWTENGTATRWKVIYGTCESLNSQDCDTSMVTVNGTPTANLTGLTANTTYYAKVYAICGGSDESDYSTTISFKTLCNPTTLTSTDWTENFDTYTAGNNVLPICWSYINTTTYSTYAAYPRVYSTNAFSAPNCLYFYSYYSSWSNYDPQPQYAILPMMTDLTGKQITLQARGYNTSSTFKIGTMTDPSNPSTFVPITEQTGLTTSYQEFTYPLSGTNKCVVIMIDAANSTRTTNGVYIDDIVINDAPSCVKPVGLTATADGQNVTITWTSEATSFDVNYNTTGEITDLDMTNLYMLTDGSANYTHNGTTHTFTIENLPVDQDYYFWVWANCGTMDQSNPAGPASVHIGYCVPTLTSTTTTYYISGFTTTGGITNIDNATTGTGRSYSNFYNTHSASAYPGLTIDFTITIAGGSTYGSAVWVDWNNDMQFSEDERVYHTTSYTSSPHNGSFTVPANTALGDYRMRIVSDYSGSNPSNPCSASTGEFEDYKLTITEVPSCLPPTALTLSRNGNQITAAWESEATSFNIDINGTVTENVTNPYVFNAELSTTYTVKVQANCSGETSEWTNTQSITTPACWNGHTIEYTFNDSYGDGWNDASITFINGCEETTLTLSSGSSTSGTINSCADYISFIWNSGLYDSECSFTFTEGGNTLFTKPSSVSDGLVLYTIGTQTCPKPTDFDYGTLGARSVDLSWTENGTAEAWQLCVNDDMDHLVDVTAADLNNGLYTLGHLAPETEYTVKVRSVCGVSDVSCWSDEIIFSTITGTAVPTGLAVEQSTITSSTATASWTGVATNDYHASYDLYWATSDVASVPDEPAAPNFVAGITATSYQITGLTPETEYKVWVRDNCGTDGYSAWTSAVTFATAADCQSPDGLAAANITAHTADITWNTYGQTGFNLRYKKSTDEAWTDVPDAGTSYQMTHLDPETTYQVEVQATCNTEEWSSTYDFNTTVACPDPTNLAVTNGSVTAHGATITWDGSADNYIIMVGEEQVALNTDFEGNAIPDGFTTTGSYPWTTVANNHSGSYCVKSGNVGVNSSTSDLVYEVTLTESATLTFSAKISSESSYDEGYFSIDGVTKIDAISGNGNWIDYSYPLAAGTHTLRWYYTKDGSEFDNDDCFYLDDIKIAAEPSSWNESRSTHQETYTLNDLEPEHSYMVKVKGDCTSNSDGYSEPSASVSFTTNPSCYPVGTLAAATNVTPFAASLSWTLVDDNQTQWDVQYATDNAFSENVGIRENVDVHTNYELNHLTPETEYYVRVRANCGSTDGYGAWSNVINFTTAIACQKPTNLALVEEEGNPTQTTAKLSWTENGLASAWTIAYKAEGADEFIERMIIDDPTTTLNNLTQGTNYTVKVRAICGGDYGNSQWSDEFNFQTIASCPTPENLAVTDNSETAHGATITWDGEADSYNIEYAEGPLAGLATLLDEGFEGGSMPTGWTTDGPGTWSVNTGDYSSSTGAGEGTYNAKITHSTTNNVTKLITPAIDLSSVSNPVLSYMHIQRKWGSDQDQLRVYYRTASSESWTLIAGQEYTSNITSWTTENNIALPNPSSTYQIAFEMTDGYGYGVGLDDITITAEYTPTYSWNTLVSGITEEEYVITELDPQTDYVVRVRGNCSGTLSPESNSEIVGFTTGIACQAPTALTYNDLTLTRDEVYLTWTENGSATKWQICVNGDEENLIDLYASDVTIDGNTITRHMLNLLWETPYTMKVRANCEGEGYSDWSNTVNFTTQVGCGAPTALTLGTVEVHQASFSWTGGVYNESWNVYVKKHSDASYPTTPNTEMTFTPSTTINGLDAETAYDVKIVPNCDENKFLEVPNAFTTAVACPAPTNLAVTDGSITANGATITWDGTSSDGYVVSVGTYDYTATPITGTILEEDFESGMPEGWTHLGAGSISVQTPSAVYVHGGTHVLRFSGTNSYNLAVMPELPVETNQLTLDFWSRAEGQSSGTFEYGYVTDATDANTFQAIGSWMASTTNNHEHIENISFSSAPDGARIAFRHQSGSSSWYWFIDDITISGPTYPISWTEYNTTDQSYTFDNLDPETFYMVKVKGNCGEEGYSNETEAISFTTAAGCQVPDGLAASNVTNNSATISWNAYGQTGFNLRYSTDGENWTTENDVTNPYLFNEVLIGNTEYQVQVQVTCNTEAWSNVLNFTTKCDALSGNDFPWSEDFESYSTGNFSDNCWVNEHISGNGTSIFNVTTSSLGGNSTHKLQLPDQSAGTLTKLVLPAMTLPNANYVFSIDVYRNTNYSDKTGEGIRVYASTDGEIAGATELAFIPRVRTVESGIVPAESADGWYTYQLPIGISGTCYIILRGESQWGNATYMDNFKVAEYSVEKTYEPNKWYAIASPVHDIYGTAQSVGDGTTVNLATDPYDLYSYNEVEGSWMNYKNNPFDLEMGMGYIYRHGGDNNRTVSYVGAPNSGDINVTITSDCSDDDLKGFNLLGNPYPHEYTLSSAHYTLSTNGCWMSHPSGTIAVAEGFLVSAESDHFDFTENSSKASNSTSAIAFTVSNGEYEDVAYALLENGHGLPKIGHLNSEAPMLSIPVDNRRYAVAMLGEECQGFDMVFRATTGQYTLTVDNGIEGLSYLHLLDRATGRDIDLLREHTYTFNVTASNADRFSVKLSPEAVESTSAHFAYWNGNNWVVEGTGMLQVYDVTGRCLSTLEVDGKLTTDNGNLGISHTGVYVFRMGEKSQKIVVK